MIILLNNKSFSDKDLLERLYSESWKIEQREYGIVKKILRKTVRPILKNMINNRQKSMDVLNESIKNNYVSDKRPEVMKALGRKAKELGAKVLKGKKTDRLGSEFRKVKEKKSKVNLSRSKNWEYESKNTNELLKNRLINSSYPKQRELGKAIIDNRFVISHKGSQASLAHEIGHVIDDSKNKFPKELISKVKSKGISGAIKEYKSASKIVNKEKSASKNAINLLKESGATNKELKKAEKELLDESLKTYKLSRSKKTLEALNRGLDDLTQYEKDRLKFNRKNKIEKIKSSVKSIFNKKK